MYTAAERAAVFPGPATSVAGRQGMLMRRLRGITITRLARTLCGLPVPARPARSLLALATLLELSHTYHLTTKWTEERPAQIFLSDRLYPLL